MTYSPSIMLSSLFKNSTSLGVKPLVSLCFGNTALGSGHWTGHRHVHFKKAIRPPILPDGLPVDTIPWQKVRKDMRLTFLRDDNVTLDPAEVTSMRELVPLKANVTEMDCKVIRKNQGLLYYHRLSLLRQRNKYLHSIHQTPRQKYLDIKTNPPALIISWGPNKEVSYLRGIMKEEGTELAILYPMLYFLYNTKYEIQQRCEEVGTDLGISQEKVLRLALDIPCFMLNRKIAETSGHKFLYIHKFLLTPTYKFDDFTAKMMPPIVNGKHVVSKYRKVVKGEGPEDVFSLRDLLNTKYPECHGKGTPEDLSDFLLSERKQESYSLKVKPLHRRIDHYW